MSACVTASPPPSYPWADGSTSEVMVVNKHVLLWLCNFSRARTFTSEILWRASRRSLHAQRTWNSFVIKLDDLSPRSSSSIGHSGMLSITNRNWVHLDSWKTRWILHKKNHEKCCYSTRVYVCPVCWRSSYILRDIQRNSKRCLPMYCACAFICVHTWSLSSQLLVQYVGGTASCKLSTEAQCWRNIPL